MATAVVLPPSPPAPSSAPARVAPWLHTILIVLLMLFLSFYGSGGRQQQEVQRYGRLPGYASIILIEWLIVGLVWVGLRRQRVSLRELVGGRWDNFETALIDAAIAFGFWLAALVVLIAAAFALGIAHTTPAEMRRTVGFLAPHNGTELLAWMAVCLTAGFCEEVIFRGFFQRQFSALLRTPWAGVVLQGVLFGASHGYQGTRHMAQLAVFGILFGILALWRRSLRPGMIAHAWQDIFSGVGLFLAGKIYGWW